MRQTAHVIENFLSDEEILEIELNFRKYRDVDLWLAPYEEDKCQALYVYPGPKYKSAVNNYMTEKVNKVLVENHYFSDSWHLLNSYLPYGMHTDAFDDNDPNAHLHSQREGMEFGYTFLIPLSDYNSHTIVFNEHAEYTKTFQTWKVKENAQPKYLIDDETYNNLLTHHSKEQVSYFSLDTVFKWKKGDLLVMPRAAFHCSDNFLQNNLFEKRALIGWSYIPKT